MTTQVKVTQQPNISLKVANPQNKQVRQVAIGQVDASSIELNELANVDTTTESLQSGTTLIFDASTNKFEAANNIDGGTY
jgi:hypothetical protein